MDSKALKLHNEYLTSSLDLAEDVFTKWDCEKEGKLVRQLIEGALDNMSGWVDYSFYETLHEG